MTTNITTGAAGPGGPAGADGAITPPDTDILGGASKDFTTITVGSGLDLTKGTLTATGGGGTPASPDTSIQFNDGGKFGGSNLLYDSGAGTFSTATSFSLTEVADGIEIALNSHGGLFDTPGLQVLGNPGFISVGPLTGAGNGQFELDSFGSSPGTIEFNAAGGTKESPANLSSTQPIGLFTFTPYGDSFTSSSVDITMAAAEDTDSTHKAASLTISTKDLTQTKADRFFIDGGGVVNTAVTPRAIAALPASPVAGMLATVNDALTPAVGVAVTAGGAASAVVCYGGSQWTVISI
jgi:hypothetical protein